MALFKRLIKVEVAGLTFTRPRMTVRVKRHADNSQTTGHVLIYNLAPENASRIYDRGDTIRVQAGYPDTIGTIFEGNIQRARNYRQDLAHITHINLGDMARAASVLGGVSARSYDGPVPVRDIAADLVTDMGLQLGPLNAIAETLTATNYVVAGQSTDALTVLLKRYGLRWFEDNGVVRFRAAGIPQVDATAFGVSPATGLIGVPRTTDEGAEAVMFLNALARIGGIMDILSVALTGRYRIVGLEHNADNWDGPFKTWVDLRGLEWRLDPLRMTGRLRSRWRSQDSSAYGYVATVGSSDTRPTLRGTRAAAVTWRCPKRLGDR